MPLTSPLLASLLNGSLLDASLLLSPPGAILDIVRGFVMAIFLLSGLLLVLVVLMQEGKGGGIAGAFGGAGAETFGVKAGTVNRFTFWVGGVFLATAVLHAGLVSTGALPTDLTKKIAAPLPAVDEPSAPGVPPAEPASPPPAAPGGSGETAPGGAPPEPAPGPAPAPAPDPAPAPAPAPNETPGK